MSGRLASTRWATRWIGGFLALCGLGLLGGCAATSVISQVTSFGPWPEGRQPGTYTFERLPSQQLRADDQLKLEGAAQPALQARGFRLVDSPERAELRVQLDASVRTEPRYRHEPGGAPYFVHPVHGAPYHWRPGLGGWWGTAGSGLSLSLALEPPWVTLEVRLIIRDQRDGRVLYETHAAHDRVGAVDEAALPYIFEAALDGFPVPPTGRRVVTVPLPQPLPERAR
ncbi:MAG: DUF4136 domain-containing protein [Burkholderiales bacterium]|nr:DUF4136 domain-containing protein [Burkholderiales bacterium]MBH2016628.1 DUF4136 domain-containing protein [Burkholderiales bacterium]